MPYSTISELPSTFNNLPIDAKRRAMQVINDRLKAGSSEESAIKQAWSVVKIGWKKVGDNWVKKNTEDFALDTKSMKDVEIFAVGKWNSRTYTEKDLYEIVNNFNILKDEVKPYLKLGHNEEQKILQSDGLTAAGWIINLKVKGKKLLADIVNIPTKIFELIEAGGYKRVSSELYINFRDHLDNTYNKVLRAVALLGADTPAVGILGDLVAQYDEEDREFENYMFETNKGGEIMSEKKSKEEIKMTEEETKKADEAKKAEEIKKAEETKKAEEIKKLEEEKKADEAKKAEEAKAAEEKKKTENIAKNTEKVEKLSKENEDLRKENKEMKIKEKEKSIVSFTDKLLTEQKIIPKQAPYLRSVLRNLNEDEILTYKEGDTEKKMSVVEAFKRLMEANVEGKLLGEISVGDTATFSKLEDAVDAEMKENPKLTYSDATKEAAKKFPQLVEAPKEIKE